MKVGGEAEYFASVSQTHDLLKLVRWARANSLPYLVLGGGSNILISDSGVRGLVIHNRCRQVRIDAVPYCEPESGAEAFLFAESGAATAGAARISVNAGLSGFEWAVSVPGTIGGAVVNNAGAHGGEVQDNLESALVLAADSVSDQGDHIGDDHISGDVVEYRLSDLDYAYRRSSLKHEGNNTLVGASLAVAQGQAQTQDLPPLEQDENIKSSVKPAVRKAGFDAVVLSANFRLTYSNDETEPKRVADQFLAHRRSTQPTEPSLGSMFVNPPNDYAGRLIEAAGLKGFCVGGAQISTLHANFMINRGDATASDIMALVDHAQGVVEAEFGMRLIPEIQLVGEWELG